MNRNVLTLQLYAVSCVIICNFYIRFKKVDLKHFFQNSFIFVFILWLQDSHPWPEQIFDHMIFFRSFVISFVTGEFLMYKIYKVKQKWNMVQLFI